jgi:nucleotide-binding universal stress UspA family protein
VLGERPAVVCHHWQRTASASALDTEAGLTLTRELADLARDIDRAAADSARRTLEEGVEAARAAGFDVTGELTSRPGGALRALTEVGDERRAAVVVCGSRGRSGVGSLLLGSVSHGLVQHSGRSVLVVPPAR